MAVYRVLFCRRVGILARSPRWTAAAALWLPLGTVLWIFDACRTGDFLLTSALTHLGGLLVALVWFGRTGFPAGSFVYATGLGVFVQTVSRYVSPHEANVNVSQFIYPGSEAYFPSYRLYWCFIWLSATAIFDLRADRAADLAGIISVGGRRTTRARAGR